MADANEILNPKKTNMRREGDAGLSVGEAGPAWDASFEKPSMTQSDFSKYSAKSRRPTPPADMLKKQYGK